MDDLLWFGAKIDSQNDFEPQSCSLNSECGDNGMTQCCVQILQTFEDGMTDQMFRCMNRGLVELDVEGKQRWSKEDETTTYSVTMKCME